MDIVVVADTTDALGTGELAVVDVRGTDEMLLALI
jgi:hypothetical protein